MNTQIKPCPFCGNDCIIEIESVWGAKEYCHVPTGCHLDKTIIKDINTWNNRPIEESLRMEIMSMFDSMGTAAWGIGLPNMFVVTGPNGKQYSVPPERAESFYEAVYKKWQIQKYDLISSYKDNISTIYNLTETIKTLEDELQVQTSLARYRSPKINEQIIRWILPSQVCPEYDKYYLVQNGQNIQIAKYVQRILSSVWITTNNVILGSVVAFAHLPYGIVRPAGNDVCL